MADPQWYWCLAHRRVEPYEACRAADRLGPFPTADEAAAALDTFQRRNAEYDLEREREQADSDGFLGTGLGRRDSADEPQR